ncbi:amino acid ABC transporter permease [Microbacterium sp. EYE_5]|uniref:amino acid ABC transporter permease n=1 Tax=unclassified Microbacterium TaxID=2609290 RepID=UPI002002ABDD|nr:MULTISPECIES: amino acid ABC transporter permease [unclassified Microbacterium]MCK6081619.1 amino acid ABC transporter permease [Microbacterium sp. EYE_382]MCK6086889.1 amino acid ABC transporter permease [Microbacterium sp. EYE_384]MCK6123613.1 amino acid ABC transporter permease [Microbacterium sp. EYE_80]MCK6126522.1 amino acid ABC transporter permease [Microbacterium sp. EYE_79]MCK6142573.1 amino acid ABC transporter permease [Microbacterium sp. EYE_39]
MTTRIPSELELDRRAYRRGRERRSVLIAIVSTLAFAAVVWLTVINTEGWSKVQQSFFDPAVALQALPKVWDGFLVNLTVLGISIFTVGGVALLIALLRTLRGPVFFPVRMLAAGYTDLFRGLPFIIVLYLVGFGLPTVVGERIDELFLGVLAVTLTYSSYVAEVIRAGIESVHPSQRLAARALGLSHVQTLRRVVLPQALRKMTPALMNDFISMQKDVGLISIIAGIDAIAAARSVTATTYNFTPYVVAGILFILLAIPTIRLADWYTARLREREQTGSVL